MPRMIAYARASASSREPRMEADRGGVLFLEYAKLRPSFVRGIALPHFRLRRLFLPSGRVLRF